MAVNITAPTTQVVNRANGVAISWNSTYPQIAYEIMYRRKGASAWSTFGRVTSTSKSVMLDTTNLNDFDEYHFRVVVYTDQQMDEANKYTGTDSSPAYSLILVPNQVSLMKMQGPDGMIEVPIYPSNEDVGAPRFGIGGKGNIPLVDTNDPLATKVHARVNGETKAMAGATATTEPTGVPNETDIDVTVTQYAYNTQAHNYYYAYTAYYYYLNSQAAVGYKQYYTESTGNNYSTYTTGPTYNRGSKYNPGTYYPSYTYTGYGALYSSYRTGPTYNKSSRYTSGTYYPTYTYYYGSPVYGYYAYTYYGYYVGGYGVYYYWGYYVGAEYVGVEYLIPTLYGVEYAFGYQYYWVGDHIFDVYYRQTGSYQGTRYSTYIARYNNTAGTRYYRKTYYYLTYYYYASYGTGYYVSGYYSTSNTAYYAKTYYYLTYYYYASYGTAYYVSGYYRYYSYGGYTSYDYTAYNYALSSNTKYSGYTTYSYYRYIPGYYKYKLTA